MNTTTVYLLLQVEGSNLLLTLDSERRDTITEQLNQLEQPVAQSVALSIIATQMTADEVVHEIPDKDELVAYATLFNVDLVGVQIDPAE